MSRKLINKKQNLPAGFTLIEVVIALVMLGVVLLLFQGVFKFLFHVDHRVEQIANTHKIQGALETYLVVNKRLPCPDGDSDGVIDGFEDITNNVCDDDRGYLPHKELSTDEIDAWGNPYFYQVIPSAAAGAATMCEASSVFAKSGTITTNAGGGGNLKYCPDTYQLACSNALPAPPVCPSGSADLAITNTSAPYYSVITPNPVEITLNNEFGVLQNNVLALVISYGENGGENFYYTASINSGIGTCDENCDGDTSFEMNTGENRDYIVSVTMDKAKHAAVLSRRYK